MHTVHLHFWDVETDPDNPVQEMELDHTDTYPNMSGPEDNDGYVQFGATTPDGKWIELRIWFELLPELVAEAKRTQQIWDERR